MAQTYTPISARKKHSTSWDAITSDFPSSFGLDVPTTERKYSKRDRSQPVCAVSKEIPHCSECFSENLIQDSRTGDLICTECGMVVDDARILTDETAISFNNLEANENQVRSATYVSTPESKKLAKRLQKAEKWTHSWAEIHQIIAKKEISRFIYDMDLPKHIELNAQNLYQKAYKKNAIQGRGIKAMVAACIYISCRQYQVPVFFQDIELHTKVEGSTIRRCFSFIMENYNITLPILNAQQFIPQLVDRLGFSDLLGKVAIRILKKLETSDWKNKINNPKHIAAVSIFFAYNILRKAKKLNIEITQKKFSETIGMSETTLRKYKKLLELAIQVHY